MDILEKCKEILFNNPQIAKIATRIVTDEDMSHPKTLSEPF